MMNRLLSAIITVVAIAHLSGSFRNEVLAFQSMPSCSKPAKPLHMTVLSYNGKKKNFKAGSPLKKAVGSLGVKPRYSCKKGDCNSCALSVGGQRIKACVGKVPPEPRLKSLQEKGLEIR